MNFFQVPNFLWDRDDLDPYERAILIHIARKTVGWGKMKDAISYSQFVLHLGMSKSKVIKTVKKLVHKKLIVKTMEKNARGDMNPNSYNFHPDVVEAANIEQGVVSEKHNGSVQEIQPLSLRNTTVVSERDRQNTLIQNKHIQNQEQQVEHADFSIFVQNPQVLQHYINTDKAIKYVVDPGLSTLDIYFSDGQTAHIAKSQLYPILKELGGVA